jgi:hypothetical protein
MFKIGQKIVCVDNKNTPLVENHDYVVDSIQYGVCSCNYALVNVGFTKERIGRVQYCTKCNTRFKIFDDIWWFAAPRFVPLDDWQQADELVKELLIPEEELV